MTLSDILPSLAAAAVERSFPVDIWGGDVACTGHDVSVSGVSLADELARRCTPFRLGSLLVCRVVAIAPPPSDLSPSDRSQYHHMGADVRRHLSIDAELGTGQLIADIAFPGACLAGAQMADVTVVDAGGIRRTLHAELPRMLCLSAPILLATRPVTVAAAPRHLDSAICPSP